ncbi:hypothetical protein [Nocardioides sp. R-C-SC26]|uniref:hypothetical protein n=1 Tax=Nocardioides sp. R-C-SC26 TaxID=2870414 RepID=UPI001E3C6FAD|nr:hypothetical protein [Nocardioides sp. R-C-SC26]
MTDGGREPEFWYCLKHSTVEGRDGCPNKDRLGPYPTQEAAARALETAAERTEAWDEDPQWNDDAPSADR